jgi:protein-S-isoprenylcysteine O-methyltransferase Ste14
MAATSLPVRSAIRLFGSTLVFGALLFLAAGTVAWPAAWAYLGIVVVILVAYSTVIARTHPDLVAERTAPPADAKAWDKPFAFLVSVAGPIAMLLLAGFDYRYGWSPAFPRSVTWLGFLLAAVGGSLSNWAVATNRFFSALVRIQTDRGHHVIDTGPYAYVRHPGYTGSIVYMAGAALLLGSLPALAGAVITSMILAVRTRFEDRTLQQELDGYAAYAQRVRYRLVPGIW